MSDDIVFGPAVVGPDSIQRGILGSHNRRMAVRKPQLPTKEVSHEAKQPQPSLNIAHDRRRHLSREDDLHILSRPENLRLISIPDRKAPDFCEVCGIEHGLFWTGTMVMCIQCSKDAKLFKKEHMAFIEKAKTPQEFMLWLSHQKYLMRRLFDVRH